MEEAEAVLSMDSDISFTHIKVLLLLPSAVLDLTVDGKANSCCLLLTVLSYKNQQPGAPLSGLEFEDDCHQLVFQGQVSSTSLRTTIVLLLYNDSPMASPRASPRAALPKRDPYDLPCRSAPCFVTSQQKASQLFRWQMCR